MARERFAASDPREWLARARSNFAQVSEARAEVDLEDLCFNEQQAAEKAIKGVMLHHRIDFPYTHDLDRLLSLLHKEGVAVPNPVATADELTRYAVLTRYPLANERTRHCRGIGTRGPIRRGRAGVGAGDHSRSYTRFPAR